jgi:hypothetical protein
MRRFKTIPQIEKDIGRKLRPGDIIRTHKGTIGFFISHKSHLYHKFTLYIISHKYFVNKEYLALNKYSLSYELVTGNDYNVYYKMFNKKINKLCSKNEIEVHWSHIIKNEYKPHEYATWA